MKLYLTITNMCICITLFGQGLKGFEYKGVQGGGGVGNINFPTNEYLPDRQSYILSFSIHKTINKNIYGLGINFINTSNSGLGVFTPVQGVRHIGPYYGRTVLSTKGFSISGNIGPSIVFGKRIIDYNNVCGNKVLFCKEGYEIEKFASMGILVEVKLMYVHPKNGVGFCVSEYYNINSSYFSCFPRWVTYESILILNHLRSRSWLGSPAKII
jgi:hypothetical protein